MTYKQNNWRLALRANFSVAFSSLLELEGAYSKDPLDRGGETKYGISKKAYPHLDIKNLTLEQAKTIYKNDYWDKLRLDEVDSHEIAWELFKTAVNMGIHWAGNFTQRALNILGASLVVDGIIGKKTLFALNTLKHKKAFIALFRHLVVERYLDIVSKDKSQEIFLAGWLNRVTA